MTAAALLPVALKGVLLLAAAFLALRLLRGAPAAVRHSVWTATFAALLVVPVLDAFGPSWALPILPREHHVSHEETVETHVVTESFVGPLPDGTLLLDRGEFLHHGAPIVRPEPLARALPGRTVVGPPDAPRPDAALAPVVSRGLPLRGFPLGSLLVGLWALGAGVVLLRWAAAYASAAFLVRAARPVTDDDWLDLAERARRLVGVRGDVRLVQSSALAVPVAWGLGATAVVLPADADAWSEGRREAVLLHEMAHLRRGDARTQLVAQLAVALHWPNPLAWLAYRRFLAEREHACDDAVLSGGAAPSDYAGHLVEIARRAGRRDAVALAAFSPMARRSDLEGRILSVLDAGRRRLAAGRSPLARTVALGLLVAAPLGTVQAVASAQSSTLTVDDRRAPPDPPTPPEAPEAPLAPTAPLAPEAPLAPAAPLAPEAPHHTAAAIGAALEAALRDTIPRAETVLGPALDATLANVRQMRANGLGLSDDAWDAIEDDIREAFQEARLEYDEAVAEALADAEEERREGDADWRADLREALAEAEADRQEAAEEMAEAAAERAAVWSRSHDARQHADRQTRAAQQATHDAERSQRAHEQALRDAERIREHALAVAEASRLRSLAEGERAREKALREAEQARREALRRADDARQDALREAQRARDRARRAADRDPSSATAQPGRASAAFGYAYSVTDGGRVTVVAARPGVGVWMSALSVLDHAAARLAEALSKIETRKHAQAGALAALRGGLAGLEDGLSDVAKAAQVWVRSDAEREIARTRLEVTRSHLREIRKRLYDCG